MAVHLLSSITIVPPSALALHKSGANLEVSILSLKVSSELRRAVGDCGYNSLNLQAFPQNRYFP